MQTLTWVSIPEHQGKTGVKASVQFVGKTFRSLWKTSGLPTVMMNVTIFAGVIVALGTFTQPYMKEAGIPLEYFGVVYSVFLIIAAFLARFSSNLEEKFGGARSLNVLTAAAILPLAIIGFGYVSMIGVGLFFLVLLIENLRSPLANELFHERVTSKSRATAGSVLSLAKTAGQIVILPVMGYVADLYSIFTAILILAGMVILTVLLFSIQSTKKNPNEYFSLKPSIGWNTFYPFYDAMVGVEKNTALVPLGSDFCRKYGRGDRNDVRDR